MYCFGQPIFAPLPMGVTVPSKKPVMLLTVRVVVSVGFCFCIISLNIVYTYKGCVI